MNTILDPIFEDYERKETKSVYEQLMRDSEIQPKEASI
jgi:hypothetical protein